MTENKRFIADNEYVMQDDEVYVVCKGEHSADVVATALNELIEENEQLKQGMDKLFDYFAKWFEEERGVYIEDFIELWKSIQKGDVE